jgi:hypothetical protein
MSFSSGDSANIWTAINDAIGATQGIWGQNLPRNTGTGSGNGAATSSQV